MDPDAPDARSDSHGLPSGPLDPARPVYLRVGLWNPARPYSKNYARGEQEAGLSVYDLKDGVPVVPTESEWAEVDMRERLASNQPTFLVQGQIVGEGHDVEPLLGKVIVVGLWTSGTNPLDRTFSI